MFVIYGYEAGIYGAVEYRNFNVGLNKVYFYTAVLVSWYGDGNKKWELKSNIL